MWCEPPLLHAHWPSFDPKSAEEEKVIVVIQVNGKLRSKFEAERDLPEEQIREKALGLNRIRNIVKDEEIKKVIYIKNKLINIVL